MAIAGAGFGAAQGLEQILAEQMVRAQLAQRQKEAEQQAAIQQQRLAQDAIEGNARIQQGQQQLELGERSRRDRSNIESLELRDKDKAQMDREQIMGSLPPRLKQIADMRQVGVTGISPQDLQTPDETAAAQAAADKRTLNMEEEKAKIGAKYRKPDTPSSADYEWVLGQDGKPRQIIKGSAQPGDSPYRAPQSISENAQDRQRSARVGAAKDFLDRLNTLRTKINTKMGPEAGLSGMARRGGAAIGMDPDVAEYQRIRAAGGRALAVAIMGAQNLSDQDANAWANMLPDATTDEETAKRLTTQVEKMLTGMTGETPPKTDGGAFSVQAPNGKTYTFQSAEELATFKAKAGIK